MCSPTVVVDVVPITHPNGFTVVAVNVDPYVEQLIAAPAGTRDHNGKLRKHAEAWTFPVRRGSQTEFVEPEYLAMHMNRQIRRAVLLLAAIPDESRRALTVHYHERRAVTGGALDVHVVNQQGMQLDDVSVERNRVRFSQHARLYLNVPLLDVLDAWESGEDRWDILLAGEIRREKNANGDHLTYNPMPRRS